MLGHQRGEGLRFVGKWWSQKMQRKFRLLFKDKATADSANDRDNVGTRFTCGSQFSRKYVGSAFSCVLGNKPTHGKHNSKVKKKETHGGDLGKRKALSQLLGIEESYRGVEGKQKRKNMQRVNVPLLSFLDKKKRKNNFLRTRFSNVVTRFGQVGRKVSLRHLVRTPSNVLVFGLKLKMKFLVRKKAIKQFEQEGDDEENEDRELCKKRILMGGRCRPLNSPGYDTYGFFLPRAQHHP